MGFWFWFWTWLVLILGAMAMFLALGMSLLKRLNEAANQTQPIAEKINFLAQLATQTPEVARPEPSLLKEPAETLSRKRALDKAKIKKREARERRLIKSLKHFDPNESRFH